MSGTSGTADQVLSLPRGGGAVRALGETFRPDLHTGTGTFAIPIDIPNGPNDIAPKVALMYDSAGGSGPFGMGFSMPFFTITRSTSRSLPAYIDDDPLTLLGAGDLVALSGGRFRLEIDAARLRIERQGKGFCVTDPDGRQYRMGTHAGSRVATKPESGEAFAWLLDSIEDSLGNRVTFSYYRDEHQLYVERIDYSIYSLRFHYEDRPDPLCTGKPGFLVTTRKRCRSIELHIVGAQQSRVREWALSYKQAERSGHSLLHRVRLTGFSELGTSAALPPLTLYYTDMEPPEAIARLDAPSNCVPDFEHGDVELLDWDGNGLPDLFEIAGGYSRIWRNLGDGKWASPESIKLQSPAGLPLPLALGSDAIGFADMDGNGTADLVVTDTSLNQGGYFPHLPGGGFGEGVRWPIAPIVKLSDPGVHLVDLNGDGIVDLLVLGYPKCHLFYRDRQGNWETESVEIPAFMSFLADARARVHLADMSGDGMQDVVRITDSGITCWPYLGMGRWGTASLWPLPALPAHFDPDRLLLVDVDGDGRADLVYADDHVVRCWLNLSQATAGGYPGWSKPIEMAYDTSSAPMNGRALRTADMMGRATKGVLWSRKASGGGAARLLFADFAGPRKPYLLNRIDNGMGLVTTIHYSTSTAEAVRDRAAGRAWSTFLPFPVPVVSEVGTRDQVTGQSSTVRYVYHDGHYDGVLREFAGFVEVEERIAGDGAAPEMLTRTRFHVGLDPETLKPPTSTKQARRLRALRGRVVETSIFGIDGDEAQDQPYTRTETSWDVEVTQAPGGAEILFPHMVESTTYHHERQVTPFRVERVRSSYDEGGDLIEQEQRATLAGDPSPPRILRTVTTYAADAAGRFRGKPARIRQYDGNDALVTDTVSRYDDLPEGQIGKAGILTSQDTLVLPYALVTEVYGTSPPHLADVGYHRAEGGYWIHQIRYHRIDEGDSLRGTSTNARGYSQEITFDTHRIHPSLVRDALGNTLTAEFDYRANKPRLIRHQNGAVAWNRYDPLGRVQQVIEHGASADYPTIGFTYRHDSLPLQVVQRQRAVDGDPGVIERRSFLDGFGRVVEQRVKTPEGELSELTRIYTARGHLCTEALPRPAVDPPGRLDEGVPRRRYRYDVLGRWIGMTNPDGSIRRREFKSAEMLVHDEQGVMSKVVAPPWRYAFGANGLPQLATRKVGDEDVTTRFSYDIKGNLTEVIDASGHCTRFRYDLLGRRLLTDSPTRGRLVFVYDANGNPVERRTGGNTVHFAYDELDRPLRSWSSRGESFAECVYHDTDRPAPAGAGPEAIGRLVLARYPVGATAFAYTPGGKIAGKTFTRRGGDAPPLTVRYRYRSDGQIETITYPRAAIAEVPLTVTYHYDEAGRLEGIGGVITKITYDAAGNRATVVYANGVTAEHRRDSTTRRLRAIQISKPSVENRPLIYLAYGHNVRGDITRIRSLDPDLDMSYEYDGVRRLRRARSRSGNEWTYRYASDGNLRFKSDVGVYDYDDAAHLLSAGGQRFGHTEDGRLLYSEAESRYDGAGHLCALTLGGASIEYGYDHTGNQVLARRVAANKVEERWSPDDHIALEDGSLWATVFDGSVRVARIRLDGAGFGILHGDHLGSTLLVTGRAGETLHRFHYDPFGNVREEQEAAGSGVSRYLFTNGAWDSWSKLYYLRSRAYDPALGRFLAPDTLVPGVLDPFAWNPYSYVNNNPVCMIDPTGHGFLEVVTGAALLVGAGALAVGTMGLGSPLIAVGIATIAGGVAGAVAADRGGGDVFAGFLFGAGFGGMAAVGGIWLGVAAQAHVGYSLLGVNLGNLLGGALGGAIIGAGTGLAAGMGQVVSGGQADWDLVLKGFARGGLSGGVAGALGGVGGAGEGLFKNGALQGPPLMQVLTRGAAAAGAEWLQQKATGGGTSWGRVGLVGGVAVALGLLPAESGSSRVKPNDLKGSLQKDVALIGSSSSAAIASTTYVLDISHDLFSLSLL